jgi:hypothetical protein
MKVIAMAILSSGLLSAGAFPEAEIANGQIRAKIYLPDAAKGFYRGTRFDWSGVVYSLVYRGHDFYGPWFQKMDPKVHDFIYSGADVIAGPCSAIAGPVEEFTLNRSTLGYAEAKPGGTFVKIGVGVLRKPEEPRYDNYRLYEIVDPGKWTVRPTGDSVEFTQEVADPASGYAYRYRKTVRLAKGKPEMVIEHTLANTGRRAIETQVYDHNFLALDKMPPGPDFSIVLPFELKGGRAPEQGVGAIQGNRIVYLKQLQGEDRMTAAIEGFGATAKDYDIRVENTKAGVGVRVTGDRPVVSEALWSIRTVLSVEPFIAMSIEPGQEFRWKYNYEYYPLPRAGK